MYKEGSKCSACGFEIAGPDLHSRAYVYTSRLTRLDVEFGKAIILSEKENDAGVSRFDEPKGSSNELHFEIDALFGGELQLLESAENLELPVRKADA